MGIIVPPKPPSKEELNERIKNGARTMKELDPAFYEYCKQGERFRKFAIIIVALTGVVVLVTTIPIIWKTL